MADSADGRDREAALRRAIQASEQRGIPFAPGKHELWCCLRMRLIPAPFLQRLHATITADATCNAPALHRIPVEYEGEGKDRIVVSTPEREALFQQRRVHIAALLQLIPGQRAAGGPRPPSGPRATLAVTTATDGADEPQIGRAHV